jgi:hypothetical protein
MIIVPEYLYYSIGLMVEIEATIIQLTEFCIQDHICNRFDSLVSNVTIKKKDNELFQFFNYLKKSLKIPKTHPKHIRYNQLLITSVNVQNKKVHKCNMTNMYNPQVRNIYLYLLNHNNKDIIVL